MSVSFFWDTVYRFCKYFFQFAFQQMGRWNWFELFRQRRPQRSLIFNLSLAKSTAATHNQTVLKLNDWLNINEILRQIIRYHQQNSLLAWRSLFVVYTCSFTLSRRSHIGGTGSSDQGKWTVSCWKILWGYAQCRCGTVNPVEYHA